MQTLLLVLCVLASLDVAVAAVVHVRHHDDPVAMPLFRTTGAVPHKGDDPYRPLPTAYRFDTDPDVKVDAEGHVRRTVDGKPVFDPGASAGYAIALLSDPTPANIRAAGAAMDELLPLSETGFVLHDQPAKNLFGQPMAPPWVSASDQGLALSAFSRLHRLTGRNRWGDAADAAFGAFLEFRGYPREGAPVPPLWISTVDDENEMWFEQSPQGKNPTRELEGHLYAVTGIYDYWLQETDVSSKRAAAKLFDGGVSTAAGIVPDLRVPLQPSLVSPFWGTPDASAHQVVRQQLISLADVGGGNVLRRFYRLYTKDGVLPQFNNSGLTPEADIDVYARGADSLVDRAMLDGRDLDLVEALDELSRSRERGDAPARRAARLVDGVLSSTRLGLVPHNSVVRNSYGSELSVPWFSAQTQGLLISAATRLATSTDDRRWDGVAEDAFTTLLRFGRFRGNTGTAPDPWISTVGDLSDRNNLWFEVRPDPQGDAGRQYGANSEVMPAHITALIGAYDYWRATKDPYSSKVFDGGATTVLSRAPDLLSSSGEFRDNLVTEKGTPGSRRVLIRQLNELERITDRFEFGWAALDLRLGAS